MIYFIHKPAEDAIKIGYSADPMRRLAAFRTGSAVPLVMLDILDGCRGREKAVHGQFAASKIHGEWYRAAPVMKVLANTGDEGRYAWMKLFGIDGRQCWEYIPFRELDNMSASLFLSTFRKQPGTTAEQGKKLAEKFLATIPRLENFLWLELIEFPELAEFIP